MADTRLASGRLLSQWQSCDPDFMSQMSKAAICHALNDAKTDILSLAAELEHASQTRSREAVKLLADKHTGMRVDYQGLFKQARGALRREPAIAEMLRQFQDHVTELGQRWYSGDTSVVDELLQLYCVERAARTALDIGKE